MGCRTSKPAGACRLNAGKVILPALVLWVVAAQGGASPKTSDWEIRVGLAAEPVSPPAFGAGPACSVCAAEPEILGGPKGGPPLWGQGSSAGKETAGGRWAAELSFSLPPGNLKEKYSL